MKSSAINLLVCSPFFIFFGHAAYGQVDPFPKRQGTEKLPSCTCQPSPPGATTECEAGEIALCLVNKRGICEGSCNKIDEHHSPKMYFSELVYVIFHRDISEEYALQHRSEVKELIEEILQSNSTDKRTMIYFMDEGVSLTITLPEIAIQKLTSLRNSL